MGVGEEAAGEAGLEALSILAHSVSRDLLFTGTEDQIVDDFFLYIFFPTATNSSNKLQFPCAPLSGMLFSGGSQGVQLGSINS